LRREFGKFYDVNKVRNSWDPVPGSTGQKVPVSGSEDEDDEGRSDNEQLVEEGAAGAELDRMLQATKDAAT